MNDKNIEEKEKTVSKESLHIEKKTKEKQRPYTWTWLVRQMGYKIIR